MHLWGVEGRKTALQGFHLVFSLGTTVSPFILEPFLSKRRIPSSNITETVNTSLANHSSGFSGSRESSTINTTYTFNKMEFCNTNIHYAYIISGILGLVSAGGLLLRYFLDQSRNQAQNDKETDDKSGVPKWKVFVTLFLFLMLYFFLDEVEDTSPAFLSTFLVLSLAWTKIQGVRVTSAFYGAFTAGRLLGTITIKFVSHVTFFIVCSCALVMSLIGLLLSVKFHLEAGVWLSVVTLGASLSVIMPATLTWMEEEFLTVSGKIVSVVFVGLSLGGIANPQLIGYCMQHVTHMSYSYILLAEAVLFVLTLVVLKVFQTRCIRPHLNQCQGESHTTKELMAKVDL